MNKKNIFIGSIILVVIAIFYFWFMNHYGKSNATSETNKGYVSGHVSIGPICPVQREGEPCLIPPETYTSREVIIYKANSKTILKKVRLDSEGNYEIALKSGNYWVQINHAGIGEGEKKEAVIKSSQTEIIDFDIDTGIR